MEEVSADFTSCSWLCQHTLRTILQTMSLGTLPGLKNLNFFFCFNPCTNMFQLPMILLYAGYYVFSMMLQWFQQQT
jgi:hypothetical protein